MQLTSLLKACTVFAMQALIGIAASTATSVVTAASVKINMYLDSDRSSTGGCSVTTATRAITGIDYGLQFTIDDTAKTVSAVDVQNCQNGVLAKNHTAQGVWTYSSGTTADVIRGTIARSDFGGAAIFGTVIASTIDGQVQDVLDGGNSTGFAGFPILASDAAAIVASVPIPTLAQMALPILATLIGLFGMWCVYRKRDAAKNILNSVLIGGLALALAAPVQKVIAAVGTIVSYIDQPATTAANDVQRIRSGDVLNSSITLDPSTLTYAIEIQLRNPTMSNEALQIALLEQGQDFSPIAPSEDVDVVAPPPKTNTTFKGQKVAAGRIEIKANSSVSFDSMKSFVESKQWRIIGRDRVFDTYTVDLNGKLSVEEAVTLAKTSLLVKRAIAIPIVELYSISNDPLYASGNADRHLKAIKAPQAWALLDGSQVKTKVGVIDGGFRYLHEDLSSSILGIFAATTGRLDVEGSQANNSVVIDICSAIFRIIDQIDGNQQCRNANHGMHVAGVIGSVRNNSKGVAGSGSNNTSLYTFKSSLTLDSVRAGFRTLAAQDVRIINMSFGTGHCGADDASNCSVEPVVSDSDFEDTLDTFVEIADLYPQILFVQASGNNGRAVWSGSTRPIYSDFSNYFASASSKKWAVTTTQIAKIDRLRQQSLIVGSFDVDSASSARARSAFTQTPSPESGAGYPFILAPGSDVQSTLFTETNAYGTKSGTSMATPHVVGVASLVLQANASLTAYETQKIILGSADNQTGTTWLDGDGHRYLNAEMSVRNARAPVISNAMLSTGGVVTSATGFTFQIDPTRAGVVKVEINPGDGTGWREVVSGRGIMAQTQFMASHVFTTPGTKTVQFRVTDILDRVEGLNLDVTISSGAATSLTTWLAGSSGSTLTTSHVANTAGILSYVGATPSFAAFQNRLLSPVTGDKVRIAARIRCAPSCFSAYDIYLGLDNSAAQAASSAAPKNVTVGVFTGYSPDRMNIVGVEYRGTANYGDTRLWHTYTLEVNGGRAKYYLDGVLKIDSPFAGTVGQLDTLTIAFRGAGEIDATGVTVTPLP